MLSGRAPFLTCPILNHTCSKHAGFINCCDIRAEIRYEVFQLHVQRTVMQHCEVSPPWGSVCARCPLRQLGFVHNHSNQMIWLLQDQ